MQSAHRHLPTAEQAFEIAEAALESGLFPHRLFFGAFTEAEYTSLKAFVANLRGAYDQAVARLEGQG